jgi:hypothetical protein
MSPSTDPIATAVARLEATVKHLADVQAEHSKQLKWVSYAALLVASLVGGPNAVHVLTGVGA